MDTLLSLIASVCIHTGLFALGWFLHCLYAGASRPQRSMVSLGDPVLVQLPSAGPLWTYGVIAGFAGTQYLPYKIKLADGAIVYSDGTNIVKLPPQEQHAESPVTYRDYAQTNDK